MSIDRLSPADEGLLLDAKRKLEQPSLAIRAAALLGSPFERSSMLLPERAREVLADVTHRAVAQGLEWSLRTLEGRSQTQPPQNRLHKALAAVTGAAGGVFGLPALAVELPVSTIIMLRSIADIAAHHGEDLAATEGRLACIEVFALGGFSPSDDAAETGYYAARAALAHTFSEALRFVAQAGASSMTAPPLWRLVSAVASRFGLVVSDKLVLASIPVLSAAAGAALNTLFVDHFQNMADGHFVVRKLERQYGRALVQARYRAVAVED